MLGLDRWHVFKGLAAIFCIAGISWLALNYFVPSPPSKITIATAFRGGAYELFGNKYKDILARAHVQLEVRLTDGSVENIKLLEDQSSGVQVAFVQGGVSNSKQSPGLVSLGRINYQLFWIFYRATETLDHLKQLTGKRIAVGPVGSGTQVVAKQILGISGVTPETATLLPLAGQAAVKTLNEGTADAIFLAFAPDAPVIQSLLRDTNIRLMSFPRAEALSRIFPFLVRLVLPQGVIDFKNNIPTNDVVLIGTTNAVLVRDDLHPQIVHLLAQALMEVHGDPGLFQRAGEFPTQTDPEYPIAESARDFYKNGPSFLHRYLPFWVANYAQRIIAVTLAAIAIVLPAFSYAPKLYMLFIRERLRKLYRRLRVVEKSLQVELTVPQAEALQSDLADIERAATVLPMRESDLFFSFRIHLDRTRSNLASRLVEMRNQKNKVI